LEKEACSWDDGCIRGDTKNGRGRRSRKKLDNLGKGERKMRVLVSYWVKRQKKTREASCCQVGGVRREQKERKVPIIK